MKTQIVRNIIWVVFFSLIGLSDAVLADQPVVTPEQVAQLLDWIGKHSDYEVSEFLHKRPEIEFCGCGETIQYEGKPIIVHEPIKGLYDKEAYKIILIKPWNSSDLYDVSTLLHELIHLVQYNSKEWPCWQKTEWQAYKLQALWLQEHGHDAEFNWVRIFFISSCETKRDIHPSLYMH